MVFLGTPGAVDTITLRQAVKGEPVGMGGGFGHFGFRQPQKKRTEGIKKRELVDIGVQEVLNAGGSLVEKGEHVPGHYYAYVSDPDGYVIEL